MTLRDREDIAVRFGGDDSRFRKVLRRVRTETEGLRGHMRGAGDSIQSFFGVKLAGGIAAVASSFALLAKSALSTTDAIAKTADKIGVGVEELQQLRYAARTVNVEQGQLDTALQRFSRRIGEAANGTGELRKDIENLGIQLREPNGQMRELTDILGDYAEAVKNAESPQEQLRLAFKAFDTGGAALVNLLREGRAGMEQITTAAEELGLVIDENTVRSTEKMNQAWDDFTNSISVGFKKAVLSAIGFLDRMAGNYRTIEDIEAKIIENNERIVELKKDAKKADEFRADQYRERVRAIEKENEQLQLKLDLLKEEKRIREQDRGVTPGGGPDRSESGLSSRRKLGAPGSSGGGGADEPISVSEAVQLRADALRKFRNGEITQHQLGAESARIDYLRGDLSESEARAAQIQPELGAYGTPGNLSKPLPEAPPALRENYFGDPDDSMDTRGSGAVWEAGIAPNTQEMDRQIEQFLANRKYIIWVEPKLVGLDDIESVFMDAADKIGGRE